MAKSEVETEVTRVDLVLQQWEKPTTIDKYVFAMSQWEASFLDLQEVGEVDGRGMVLDVLFSWISLYFLIHQGLDCDLGLVYGAIHQLFAHMRSSPISSGPWCTCALVTWAQLKELKDSKKSALLGSIWLESLSWSYGM